MVWSPPKLIQVSIHVSQLRHSMQKYPAHLTIRGCSRPSSESPRVADTAWSSVSITGRASKVEYATSIWSIARALSYGLTGTYISSKFALHAD